MSSLCDIGAEEINVRHTRPTSWHKLCVMCNENSSTNGSDRNVECVAFSLMSYHLGTILV